MSIISGQDHSASAQVCSTAGAVSLTSQAEVAAFQGTYGPCDTLVDDLTISGADISDLAPLGLTSVATPNNLVISSIPALLNLDGLAGLTTVFWLEITGNSALTSITGLSSLTNVNGPILIENNAVLTNVTGLDNVTALTGGALIITNNPSLTYLGGVSNITITGGSLSITNNDALSNLDDLASLTSANGIFVIDNAALTSIAGLSNVTSSVGAVYVRSNPNLASLAGLSGLSSVGGLVIDNNASLTNLDPLAGLTSVGNITALAITDNTALTDIDGLASVEGVGFDFVLTGNTSLSQCSVLERLLDDVDDFDPGPGPGTAGIPDVGDDVDISGNLAGCNSLEEILGSAPTFSVGGTVSGLAGSVTLQNNGGDDLVVNSNGSFTFSTELADSASYSVTVSVQPSGQTCSVSNGSGTISGSNVTNVAVDCVDDEPPVEPPGPPASSTPIPTIAEWAMIALVIMLCLVGAVRLRRSNI